MYADDTQSYHSSSINNYDAAKNNINDDLKSLTDFPDSELFLTVTKSCALL